MEFSAAGLAQDGNLTHGRKEIRGFGGMTFGNSYLQRLTFSGGVEVAFGLNRYFGLTADYAYNSLGKDETAFCIPPSSCTFKQTEKAHELMGGIRISVPNRSRVTPYASITTGLVRLVAKLDATGPGYDNHFSN